MPGCHPPQSCCSVPTLACPWDEVWVREGTRAELWDLSTLVFCPFPARREGRKQALVPLSSSSLALHPRRARENAASFVSPVAQKPSPWQHSQRRAGRGPLGCSARGGLGTRRAAPAARASGGSSRAPRDLEEGKGCPAAAAHGMSSSPCPPWDAERGWAPWCGLNKGLGGASMVCLARAGLPGKGAAVPKLPGILVGSMARNCLIYRQIIFK